MYPPGPKEHFLLGNLPEFGRDLLGFLSDCARRYGDVVRLRLAGSTAYLLNHPDLIEDVLVTRNRNFIKHPSSGATFGRSLARAFSPAKATSGCGSGDWSLPLFTASALPLTAR